MIVMSLGDAARAGLWISFAACAWFAPSIAEPLLRKWERAAGRFATHRLLTCAAVALVVLLTRAALLPLWPIPKPYVYDEFGYILQSETFASGRLTNPAHPLAPFFESIYVLQYPTYNAKFPPGQGLMLSVGQMIFDHPWFGVWLSCGLLAAALCWALQGWLPPAWALFGSVVALPLCISSYWMNSFWGGAVAAIGGALVVGAYPQLAPSGPGLVPPKRAHTAAWLLAVGAVLLIYTRPFEGGLLLTPVFLMLLRKHIRGRDWSAILLVAVLGAGWLGYYNYRVTGNAARLPYFEYDRQYPSTPHFNVLPLPPPHEFAHLDFTLMDRWEREAWAQARSVGFLATRFKKVYEMFDLFLGSSALLVPVALFWPQLFSTSRLRLLWWSLLSGALVVAIGAEYYQHYAAPILAVILILTVQAFRHLRVFQYSGKPIGRFLCRAIPAAMLLIAGSEQALRLSRPKTLEETYPPNARRERLADALAERGGGHVVFVRYTNYRFPQEEWIYNRADIDHAPVIWAQDMGRQENRRLMEYFKDRSFWLLKPDENPDQAVSYDGVDDAAPPP
jgi:hypothetical protein